MITLALPSKGRLKEQALEVLARAGLAVSLPGDERKYRARIEGMPRRWLGGWASLTARWC